MNSPLPPELLAAFDRGGDPLDDPMLQTWLEEHPEHLAAFAALRARLTDVASVPTATVWPARPWWRRTPIVAAAALLLASGVAWSLWSSAPPAGLSGSALPRPMLAPASAIRSVVVSSHAANAADSIFGRQESGRLVRHAIHSHTVTGRPSPTVTFRSTVSIEESFAP